MFHSEWRKIIEWQKVRFKLRERRRLISYENETHTSQRQLMNVLISIYYDSYDCAFGVAAVVDTINRMSFEMAHVRNFILLISMDI